MARQDDTGTTREDSSQQAEESQRFLSSLGRAIKVLRTDRGLSRRQLAERVDISYSYVTEIENGHKPPSSPVLRRIARALEVAPSVLLADAEARLATNLSQEHEATVGPGGEHLLYSEATPWPTLPSPSSPSVSLSPTQRRSHLARRTQSTEDAAAEMAILLRRLSPEDAERILDLARRLAR